MWWFPFREGLDRERTAVVLDRWLASQAAGGPTVWAAEERESGRLLGYIGLAVPTWLPAVLPAVEVGYRLHPGWWGRGLATEGAGASLDHGFDVLGLDRIIALCDPANHASRRVMQKLGMVYVEDVEVPLRAAQVVEVHEITRAAWGSMRR